MIKLQLANHQLIIGWRLQCGWEKYSTWQMELVFLEVRSVTSWIQDTNILSLGQISQIRKLYSKASPIFPPKQKTCKIPHVPAFGPSKTNPLNGWPSFHAIQACCLCGTLQSTSCRHLLVVANLRHWIKERKLITTINVAVAIIRLNVEVQARDHMITTLTLSKHTLL